MYSMNNKSSKTVPRRAPEYKLFKLLSTSLKRTCRLRFSGKFLLIYFRPIECHIFIIFLIYLIRKLVI